MHTFMHTYVHVIDLHAHIHAYVRTCNWPECHTEIIDGLDMHTLCSKVVGMCSKVVGMCSKVVIRCSWYAYIINNIYDNSIHQSIYI